MSKALKEELREMEMKIRSLPLTEERVEAQRAILGLFYKMESEENE